jgi:hypothetical protein
MDHRWDRSIGDARAAEAEHERYGARRVAEDPEVERRDRELERLHRVQRSAWDIGAAHWNQRDLYTRNARIDDAGYGLGPRVHPEEGSYAYHRDRVFQETEEPRASLYEGEAWPIRRYGFVPDRVARRTGTWDRLRERVKHAIGRGPRVWRSDARLLEDVSDALAAHGRLDASDVEVSVKQAEVTLEGTVPDREQKRLAEDLASACTGVRDVHNRLRVQRDEPPLFDAPVRAF